MISGLCTDGLANRVLYVLGLAPSEDTLPWAPAASDI